MPIVTGLARAAEAAKARNVEGAVLPLVERDIPIGWVGAISLALLIPIAATLASFIAGTPLAAIGWPLIFGALVYIAVVRKPREVLEGPAAADAPAGDEPEEDKSEPAVVLTKSDKSEDPDEG